MASAFEFAKAREAIREAKREIRDAERLVQTSFAPTDFRVAKARKVLQEAQSAVRGLLALLNATPGHGINFALIKEIRAAEMRVNKAREALKKIDPTATE